MSGYWSMMQKEWQGQDAFVIGGGASMTGFDWTLLHGKNTIGCNWAYRLGPDVCKVCFFCDSGFYADFNEELEAYTKQGGIVYTNNPSLRIKNIPWLRVMKRVAMGLSPIALGYGKNSGCCAVNLATIYGVHRVFLLGCDCKVSAPTADRPVNTHWHDCRRKGVKPYQNSPEASYNRFLGGWGAISQDLPKFPGFNVINLGPDSAIPYFPKQDYREILKKD
jgi:hypothetical protein